ncbi:FHA domain-containing protein [Planctomicrobium sp. SH527]|uniref:FHA domain-containing protein n=1 Tax=Planctomicrobium sp. SH527 TaxID=3448123 RepID=UPI003F5BEFD8
MQQAELSVVSGKQAGAVIPLPQGKFLIGREEDCHLRPNSELVSRHHCVFTVDEFTVRLRDLGSTNGTLVNGEKIRGGVVLNSGDIVSIGKIEFRVVIKITESDTATNIAIANDTQLISSGGTSADLPVTPAPTVNGVLGGSSFEIPTSSETLTDVPMVPQPGLSNYYMPTVGAPPGAENQFAPPGGPGMPPQMGYPPMGYPQMMPYGYPGYPQMYGQPMMGYPQMPQGYPQMPMAEPATAPVEAATESSVPSPPVKLPDPSETGAKAPAPKPVAAPAGEGKTAEAKAKEEAPKRAEDIIQQYLKRRPTTGG